MFGNKCYFRRDDENMGKFEPRSYQRIFLGYSCKRKAYKCFNLSSNKLVESENVRIDESFSYEDEEIKPNKNKKDQKQEEDQ